MSGNVVQFPRPVDVSNLTEALRWYADRIEEGALTPESVLLVVHHGESFLPEVVGLGKSLNRLEVCAILGQAHLRTQAVAFRGPHA